jgi:phenylacetate-coenzyme A ligase PaaK-like adenylate-forming protein
MLRSSTVTACVSLAPGARKAALIRPIVFISTQSWWCVRFCERTVVPALLENEEESSSLILHNYARPFIRYDTGDLAVAGGGTCACGRGFPLLGEIEGRSQECLRTPSGKEISPAILGHYLFVYHNHLDVVRHYQLVQESDRRVRLLVVPDEGWDEQRRERLRSDLANFFGDEMEVAVEPVLEIPKERSGKCPIIKLNYV